MRVYGNAQRAVAMRYALSDLLLLRGVSFIVLIRNEVAWASSPCPVRQLVHGMKRMMTQLRET